MKSTVSQRVKFILDKYDLSITALSNKINIVQTTLNRQISGETSSIPVSTIEAILHCFPDISAEWLIRGEGNMIKGEQTVSAPKSDVEFTVYVENGFLKIR